MMDPRNPLRTEKPRTDFTRGGFESHLDAMTPEERAEYARLPHDEKLRIALQARASREKEA